VTDHAGRLLGFYWILMVLGFIWAMLIEGA
jgi:hypothetical protein